MRKKLLLAAYCVLLCITVTFSWLFDIVPNHVREVVIDYEKNGLFIVNANMEAELFMQEREGDKKEDYKEVTDFKFDDTRLIPNAVIPFYLAIANDSAANTSFMVTVIIHAEDPALLDMLYIDAVVVSDDSTSGKHVYKKLSEAERIGDSESKEFSLTLYSAQNKLFIRNNSEIMLDCYLYFDRNADSTYQGKSLEIVSFRLEQ